MKELAFSVTLKDCDVQTFRAGGNGGQNQNKRDTGVRVIHRASGARGEAREERSQLQNKKLAFKRMAETSAFKAWVKRQLGADTLAKIAVDREMWPANLKTEFFENGTWIER